MHESLKPREIAILALKFSNRKLASMDFWKLLNKKFMENFHSISPMDFSQLVLGFSKAEIIDKESFIEIAIE
jgi:hypothetical protein